MTKSRTEAFSDGVIAILITIMVLELKVPHTADLHGLIEMTPVFLSYILSYIFLGIYWSNHHHLLHACQRITARIMWMNLLLLFWLSLIPFATAWLGEQHLAPLPSAIYGVVGLASALSYTALQSAILQSLGPGSALEQEVARDVKGKVSLGGYAVGTLLAFVHPWLALATFAAIAGMWLVPDRRVERSLQSHS